MFDADGNWLRKGLALPADASAFDAVTELRARVANVPTSAWDTFALYFAGDEVKPHEHLLDFDEVDEEEARLVLSSTNQSQADHARANMKAVMRAENGVEVRVFAGLFLPHADRYVEGDVRRKRFAASLGAEPPGKFGGPSAVGTFVPVAGKRSVRRSLSLASPLSVRRRSAALFQ
jgi:hypothetical protein